MFHYEILDNSQMAQELATKAFNEAISELDSLADEEYKDATLIMQLIRGTLTAGLARVHLRIFVWGAAWRA